MLPWQASNIDHIHEAKLPHLMGEMIYFYMASVTQIEASVAVTRGVIRASEPRGATMKLDPQRGEASRQAMLPQSFLLFEVVRTLSMVPTPPIEPTVGPVASTSRVVDTNRSSNALSRMVTSMLGPQHFRLVIRWRQELT